MTRLRVPVLFITFCLLLCGHIANAFVIKRIVIEGNQRISRATVLRYMPLRPGQETSPVRVREALKSLYGSGFFSNVELAEKGNNTLVILVKERPVIGSIGFGGNSLVPKDKINKVMKDTGLIRGRVFDRSVLDRLEKSLEASYIEHGRYNANIDVTVTPKPRNRVAVYIAIDEGDATKITDISIIGNHAYSAFQLKQEFDMTTARPWSFITGGNKYNKMKLEHDLKALTKFYLDRGYLRFKIDSYQASLSEDKKSAHITIRVTEGARYTFTGYRLLGDTMGASAAVRETIDLPSGELYSQRAVDAAQKAITDFYGSKGYAFTRLRVIPDINDNSKTVSLGFYVMPGRRVYVRRIMFAGNTKTADNVLRREMRQLEDAPMTTTGVERSLRNLRVLGYMKDVGVRMQPISPAADQVDLLIHVKEMSSSQAMVSGGYGSNGVGLVFGASLNQQDFMGTGNYVGLNFQRDQFNRTYQFDYVNPFITINGVSRGFHFYSHRTSPSRVGLGSYSYDKLGGFVNYRFPLSDYSGIDFSFGGEKIKLNIGANPSSQISTFIAANGRRFKHLLTTVGWDYNSYDQDPFTTKGWKHAVTASISLPAGGERLEYYKLNYKVHWFRPITKHTIFSMRGTFGYGNSYGRTVGGLPFFQNYLAGGFDTVRGFDFGSLGPKDSVGNPLGGNATLAGSAEVIFPNPVSENLRTSVFLDAGNVYNTRLNHINIGDLRYSTGIAAEWRMPMLGVIQVSLAKSLKTRNGDRPKVFDFTFGTSF